MPKFILKNNVALINGKKDEVIYGHVNVYRRAALLSNMIYFLELVLP
jgi:hypothetical protein